MFCLPVKSLEFLVLALILSKVHLIISKLKYAYPFVSYRFFLKVDPDKGTKIAKGKTKSKKSTLSPKVLALFNILKRTDL